MLIRNIVISEETLRTIGTFSINWSVFEEEYCGHNASRGKIMNISINLGEDEEAFNSAVQEFKNLICALLIEWKGEIDEEGVKYYFYNEVGIQKNKYYLSDIALICSFLRGTSDDYHAALLCIERIRNNFFHGTKDFYHLDKQKALFESACNVLYWLC